MSLQQRYTISSSIDLFCHTRHETKKYHIVESDGDDEIIVTKGEVLKILKVIEEFEGGG